ncbi:unnamed protein product [Pelagomonas calceolata]|uniref:Uncharacterized protein n=1 Tax=Pelagomonas calceolata TaxID=35677 RepID=A0A8J2WS99_9STRA|nr:unnamed protein product [Pelagomonas calceolata]
MAKLIVALCLLFGANAMGIYGGEKNGCGQTCLAVETLNSLPFPLGTIESDTCYVIEGTFPSPADALFVSSLVKCAKITIPSGSRTRRAQVNGENTEIVNEGLLGGINARLPPVGTKITNTGIRNDGDPVIINARTPRPSASEDFRRLPRAQVQSATTEITVSDPGAAEVRAFGVDITFQCYGEDATAVSDTPEVCSS